MGFFSRFTGFSARLMSKLSQLPGLSFLQNYVESARAMKHRFGDRAEDYQVYMMAGQDVVGEFKKGGGQNVGQSSAAQGEGEDIVYDDYDFDENDSSRADFMMDDYPVSDDRHSYFDDDYRGR